MKIGKGCNIHHTVQIFNPDAIEIGENVRIDAFCVLSGGKGIKIGSHTHIGCGCYFFGGSGIEADDFAQFAIGVVIHSDSDDWSGESLVGPQIPDEFKHLIRGKVTIKRHVLLGARCTVLPGVTLNEGAAVGAHSVIKNDLDEWSIYAGVPARKIKARSKTMLDLERQFLLYRAGEL